MAANTVLDHLLKSLRGAAVYNRHEYAPPTVVLWPDGEGLWTRAVQRVLQDAIPELLVLDGDAADERRGPTTWIRYKLARCEWVDSTPVVYLPGVSRQAFRGAAGFPGEARHLFASQYRGQFWTQQNGKDWTPSAFLSSADGGLALRVARDRATAQALADQLENVLRARVSDLRGHQLEASDFYQLVTKDPDGMLLQWIGAPDAVRAQWGDDRWRGFVGVCRERFGFDPEEDGQIVAVERLVTPAGAWEQVWNRYGEAPKSFATVRKALDLVPPVTLLDSANERMPANNRQQEDALREGLKALGALPKTAARDQLTKLATEHLKRADSVWGELGEAPLASAVAQLGILAERVRQGGPGNDWAALADTYRSTWWQADAAAWKALAAVQEHRDLEAVSIALRAVYLPWLEDLGARTEALAASYPNAGPDTSRTVTPAPGTIVVFVDGLRCDLGLELARLLEGFGITAGVHTAWSTLPTVTATAKPAWQPLAKRLNGNTISAAFEPSTEDGRPLKTQGFRDLLQEVGFTYLESTSPGDPSGASWTETGAFDRYGHDDGVRLAWRIEEELKSVAYRIKELIGVGWRKVLVTTDHGWLLVPGGLPKVQLPAHLTVSKWGRCAIAQPGANHGFREVPWFWGAANGIVLAPGVSAFREGMVYAHGGLSLQETLTAFLTIDAPPTASLYALRIASVKWVGLRAQLALEGDHAGVTVDLRTKPADAASTLLSESQRAKSADDTGRISILVEKDDLLGSAAVIVAVRDGSVVAKQTVTIGDN